jgi:hypothetical protein
VTADEAVVAVLDALDTATVPYMLVGSLASNFHGIPRSTRDADFVIESVAGGLERLARVLPAELALQPQASLDPVTGTTRHLIELTASPFVCELFVRSDDPHDRERFERRMHVRVLGRMAFVATAEDTILTKLRWLLEVERSKDREDIRNILAVRGSDLDWVYLRRWATEHDTLALLEAIGRSLPLL